jgi:two-component sensor histidine kinase
VSVFEKRPEGNAPPPSSDQRRAQASGADFQRLADAINALSAARGPDEIIEIIRHSARSLSGAQGIAVILNDEGHCHYLVEDAESPLWTGQKFPADACISGWAMMHNETVVVPDIFLDPRIPHEAYRPTFVRSLVMTPVGEPAPFAAIGAYWGEAGTPAPDEIAVLGALARSAATAFKNVQLYDSLRREASERRKSEEHLRLMVNELNHRVKNSLATVQSLARQSFRKAGSVEQARDAFGARLQALALIHEMLTEANWDSADLRDIVQRTVDVHAGSDPGRVAVLGPQVRLSPKAASSLAMAVNELATNAVAHGALSQTSGAVQVSWTVEDTPAGSQLVLDWRERDGPPAPAPARLGFGHRLLTQGLPADLGGTARLDFAPGGVIFRLRAPQAALAPRGADPVLAR